MRSVFFTVAAFVLVGAASAQPMRPSPGRVAPQQRFSQQGAYTQPMHPQGGYAAAPNGQRVQPGGAVYPRGGTQNVYSQGSYPPGNVYPAGGPRTGTGYTQGQNSPAPQTVPNQGASYNAQQRQRPVDRFWQQNNGPAGVTRGEHLQQWMQNHNRMSTQDQQRALSREPGFNQLPQQTQQRMLDRLQRLNSMPPQQRERVLQRSEQMERLSPNQRQDVRSAMGQLGSLPQDRRRAVAQSFRQLRPLSPEQRAQYMNSPEFRQQFSNEERGTLNQLLNVSPMLPQQ